MVKKYYPLKVGAIIQARMSSARLPKKVILPLPHGSKTSILEHIVQRIRNVQSVDEVIIATTKSVADDEIEILSEKLHVKCFRGDEYNVLSRCFLAARKNGLEIIVRLTGDNPCIDCDLMDSVIMFHVEKDCDYTTTKLYPLGTNIEVVSFNALKCAYREDITTIGKEHVTPYIRTNSNRFNVQIIEAGVDHKRPDIRLTIDTNEDYALLCAIFDFLYRKNPFFGVGEVIDLFNKKPWLKYINEKVIQKKVFLDLKEELKEAISILYMQDLKRAAKILQSKV